VPGKESRMGKHIQYRERVKDSILVCNKAKNVAEWHLKKKLIYLRAKTSRQ
jgi:hypothetical protein